MIEQYRRAVLADLDEIVSFVNLAVKEMCENGIFQWDDLYPIKEDFENDIQQGTLEVGLVGGKIAVVYAVNEECDELYKNGNWVYKDSVFKVLHRLCVHPYFQNQGIANETLDRIEETVAVSGGKSIRLDAFSQNPHAVRLYENKGYKKTGEVNLRKGLFYLMEKGLS